MNKALRVITVFLLVFLLAFSQPLLVIAKKPDTPPGQVKKADPVPSSTGTTHGQTTTPAAVSTSAYGFEVQSLTLNGSYSTDQVINTDIIIKNTSNFPWSKSDVEVAYHWVDGNGQYEVYRGDTSKLSSDLGIDEIVSQKMQVRTPSIPGVFNLSIDLIKGDTWFTAVSNSKYFKQVTITGSISASDISSGMSINDNAEFTNNPVLSIEVSPYSNQPGNDNAAFVYDYAQATDANKESIENGTAKWSTWELISNPWGKSKIKATLTDQSVGIKRLYVRYRAFKKQSVATPEDYGSAEYHYGRSEKTTGAYYADEIFFDNVNPVGGVEINNGDYSTTIRTGNLHIWASDEVNGIMGSGLNGMRWTNNCNLTDLNANNWSEWENDIADKNGVDLGTGTNMVVCVQFRDKAGNVGTFSDSIIFYVPPVGGGNGGGILDPGNETYIDANGNRIVSRLAGVPGNPYGDKNASQLGRPTVKISSTLDGSGSRHTSTLEAYIPPPEITYIDVNDTETSFNVYGVAIQKSIEADFDIRYEVWIPGCFSLIFTQCLETKEVKMTGNLENVGMAIYLYEPWWVIGGHKEVYWLWNDNPSGQWEANLNLNNSLHLGDNLFSVSKAWGVLHTDISELGDIDYGAGNILTSKFSNIVQVKDTQVDIMRTFLKENYNLETVEDNSFWTLNDIFSMIAGLQKIPQTFYSTSTTEVLIKELNTPNGNCKDGTTNGGFETLGYVGGGRASNEVVICSVSSATSPTDLYFEETVIHEFTHNYQKSISSEDIKYGQNVINEPNHVLYKYYDLVFNVKDDHWEVDQSKIDISKIPDPCSDSGPYFVTTYQCQTSYRYTALPDNPAHPMPEEEMAESSVYYFIDKGTPRNRLLLKDNDAIPSLERYNYFKSNFDI